MIDMDIFWIVTAVHMLGLAVIGGFIACMWCEIEDPEMEDFWNYA